MDTSVFNLGVNSLTAHPVPISPVLCHIMASLPLPAIRKYKFYMSYLRSLWQLVSRLQFSQMYISISP